ncbi:MAG: radical SAM protein [Nitrospirae bacterium]|nr:radical SAM protein [Nitrospirota bacterium]
MTLNPYISIGKSLLRSSPSILTLFVTSRCNAKCRMCFNWKNMDESRDRKELSVKEIEMISRNLKGIHSLILSGGEPFLRRDLNEIVRLFGQNSGTKQVSIPTNLFCADAPEMIRAIASENPRLFFRILISIDGIGNDHDAIRAHEGGFEKLTGNLSRLIHIKRSLKNLSLNSVTVVSSFNADKIIPLLDFIGGLEIDDIKLIYVRGNTREPEAKKVSPQIYRDCIRHAENLTVNKRRTASFYNNLFSSVSLVAKEDIAESLMTKKLPRPCNAGRKLIVISDTGDIFPCEILPDKLGSLRENNYDTESILKAAKAKEVLSQIKKGNCFCTMDCNAISNVIYSPASYPRVASKLIRFYMRP